MAAALNINEFKSRVNALKQNLPAEVAQINDGLALTAVQFIRSRLINQGVDGTGKDLGKYSATPLPTFFFKGQATGSGADKKMASLVKQKQKQQGKAYKGISYEEFRQLNNLPTAHITLSFTGETLADLGVIDVRTNENSVITSISARGEYSKAKYNAKGEKIGQNSTEKILEYLADRYGTNILAVNEDEQIILANAYDVELQNVIDKYLGV